MVLDLNTVGDPPSTPGERSSSPAISGKEVLLAVAVGLLLAVATNIPLLPHLSTHVPVGLSDPLLQAWQVAWDGHALLHQPGHVFDTNAFWPLKDTLAFSDALLGYAPFGLIGSGVTAAIVRYDVLHILSSALAYVGAYLLARELGVRPWAAAVAGVAFAYAPWRFSQANHLNILSSGGIPLSLFLLIRGVRSRRSWQVLAGFLVATWQVSLGFVVGLPFLYLLAGLGVLFGVRLARRPRPPIARGVLMAGAAGAAVLVSTSALLASPYTRAAALYPEARRTVSEVEFFSAPKRGFLAAPEGNLVWGTLTRPVRDRLAWPNEQTLFPGLSIAALAIVGFVGGRPAAGTTRAGLAVSAAMTAALCLGFRLAGGLLGYRLLYEHLPGWDRIRVPSRLMVFTTLALALLASLGAERLLQGRRIGGRVAVVALVGVVLLEGAGILEVRRVPRPTVGVERFAAPQLHLPMSVPNVVMLWSTDGFPRIVNGHSGIVPEQVQRTIAVSVGFPDEASVAYFRDLGVRTVVLHRELASGTLWEDAAARSTEGLDLCAAITPELVVYELGRDASTC
jgi:hypothetical protein